MKRALLVIDVQNEYFTGKLLVTYPAGSLDRILQVIEAAREKQIPVVFVQHTSPQPNASTFHKGTPEWELHPALANIEPDLLMEKKWPGSFTDTNLEAWVREHGIDTLVISGYMTQMCCDTTARQACHMGLGVEFLSDATGTLAITNAAGSVTDEELHRAILVTQAMRFSKVITTEEWFEAIG